MQTSIYKVVPKQGICLIREEESKEPLGQIRRSKGSAFMEFSWISELEMDDYDYIDHFCNEFINNPVNDFAPGDQNLQQSSSSSDENHTHNNYTHPLNLQCGSCNASITTTGAATFTTAGSSEEICHETTSVDDERPTKQIKTNPQNHSSFDCSDSSPPPAAASPSAKPPRLLENTRLEPNNNNNKHLLPNGDINTNNAPKARPNPITRTPAEAQDRVMAERKRREKLSQRFIALSSMVPGLKKMDKASVLGDAIKYLKQLQDHVKLLEKQINRKSKESVFFLKKSQLYADDDDDDSSPCERNFECVFKEEEALPAIEARVSENNVLIKIHCKKQKGFAAKLLNEIENLKLSVVNCSFLPFGQHAMDITVVAQMDDEICMTVKDLVKKLRGAFVKSM